MLNFSNLYSVNKTLRFELIPQGKTAEKISELGFLKRDTIRAVKYQQVKVLIDNYHKKFIDDVLKNVSLDWKPLAACIKEYQADKSTQEILIEEQKKKRSEIARCLSKDERFAQLTASTPNDLFHNEDFASQERELIKSFDRFTSYFTGYQTSRRNIYSSEEITTAVPYRIVNDNFPKYLQNMETFNYLKEKCPELITEIEQSLKEFLGKARLSDYFEVKGFNKCLYQNGKECGIDFYNQLIGGISHKEGTKTQGINEKINQYWQQHPDFAKENRRVKMQPLFKQILSDRTTASFVIDSIDSDQMLFTQLKDFYDTLIKPNDAGETVFDLINKVNEIARTDDRDLQQNLYVNAKYLTDVSMILTGSWETISSCMALYAERNFRTKKEKESFMKKSEFSFAELNDILEYADSDYPFNLEMQDYFAQHTNRNGKIRALDIRLYQELIMKNWETVVSIFNNLNENTLLKENKDSVEKLKTFLDNIQDLFHRLKPLNVNAEVNGDSEFYSYFNELYAKLKETVHVYNKTRNYITKKLAEPLKYKLNFDNSTLAKGWDLNCEQQNTSLIFLKDGKYYLGIMNPKNKTKFENAPKATDNEETYQKMIYKLLPSPNKMLPKVFFSRKGMETFNPSDYILEGYATGKYKKGNSFDLNFCHDLIDFFKKSIEIHTDWKNFSFRFSDTSSYQDISEFYREVSEQGYKITFQDIPVSYIEQLVNDGKLYLFQIYNKDYAPGATGTKNLHTLYWEAAFSEENLRNTVVKLNGDAELFYREAGIKNPVSHRVGEFMVNRTSFNGVSIPENYHYEYFRRANGKIKEVSPEAAEFENYLSSKGDKIVIKKVTHEIIKDRHYTVPKFMIHVPLTLNFKAKGGININEMVRREIKNNPDVRIIGLNRGERNLIFYSILNKTGELIKQGSFNSVPQARGDKTVSVNYHQKLTNRERERDEARRSWQAIGKIAELKEGYLSVVVHELSKMIVEIIEQGAMPVVILEALNFEFKRGRMHIEKQVYQKFEKMLIDKLNFLVLKDKKPTEPGGILNAYQFTGEFESFKKLGKQTGILFYVPAGYITSIDPATGFVNLFNLKSVTNISKKRAFIEKLVSFKYDAQENSFVFTADYKKFGGKAAEDMFRTNWEIFTNGKRIRYNPKLKDYETIELTDELKQVLLETGISFESGNELLDQILEHGKDEKSLREERNRKLYETLFTVLSLSVQMRNQDRELDYIISPVKSKNGTFFDSRLQSSDKTGLPTDVDSNGAYHIALKGLYLKNIIDNTEEKDLKKVSLIISNKEWFKFRQS